ncbi:eukaryotic translation initiation factor 3 subunit J-A isoform X2 [Myripristis murdjan]|uniref:eukaryotic translation initiation factor 3 subunit J-A isoform X2 n=1 Tax=Myripristis murdjan TaxID=586833 RepID=UPI0011762265|nr:eukaryotic translation initiation factor 3 subunit J-A-like isoform X2 [Myripristis murdjan]
MAEADSWDAESFEPDEPTVKPVVLDRWEGEDDDEDVKDNWDDEEEELEEEKNTETKPSEKSKVNEKTEEKQPSERKKQEQLRKRLEETQGSTDVTREEDLAEKPQKDADLRRTNEALGVSNNITGIDAISPTSRDDFTEFEKLLKDKISPYEKSIHYSGFLESLFRDLCLSLEVEDLKKINTSITVLLSEKQKQEKQNKGKKKKKGTASGGLKAKMKDDLADYGEFDGGYAQDYEDFM